MCVLQCKCTWYDLQQQHEFEAISEILFNVLNLCPGLPQVGVTPSCEGLREMGQRRGYTVCHLSDWVTNTFTHTDSRHHHFTCHAHADTHRLITQFDVSLCRAGSKLLSKAWTVHSNLWPCYRCSCWRWDTVTHLCQCDGHCWLNNPETRWNCHLVYLYISCVLYTFYYLVYKLFNACRNYWTNTIIL